MKNVVSLAALLGVGLWAQTTVPTGQIRGSAVVGVLICWPDNGQTKGECVAAQLDPSVELDRSRTPPVLRAVIASGSSVTLPPVTLPTCDIPNRGRLLHDSVDGILKFCNGTWQPLVSVSHTHWQFRTYTAILTTSQSTFAILDPTIVPGSLRVHRNGMLMTLGPDYTRGGPGAAAPVVFTAAQTPKVGDTVTLEYMW